MSDIDDMRFDLYCEIEMLEKENQKLKARLEKAEEVIHSLNKIKQIALSNSLKVKKYNIAIESYFKEKDK